MCCRRKTIGGLNCNGVSGRSTTRGPRLCETNKKCVHARGSNDGKVCIDGIVPAAAEDRERPSPRLRIGVPQAVLP